MAANAAASSWMRSQAVAKDETTSALAALNSRKTMSSWPPPPERLSLPAPPSSQSSPPSPKTVSLPVPPATLSLPEPPARKSLPPSPLITSLSAPPERLSLPSVPLMVAISVHPILLVGQYPSRLRRRLPDRMAGPGCRRKGSPRVVGRVKVAKRLIRGQDHNSFRS